MVNLLLLISLYMMHFWKSLFNCIKIWKLVIKKLLFNGKKYNLLLKKFKLLISYIWKNKKVQNKLMMVKQQKKKKQLLKSRKIKLLKRKNLLLLKKIKLSKILKIQRKMLNKLLYNHQVFGQISIFNKLFFINFFNKIFKHWKFYFCKNFIIKINIIIKIIQWPIKPKNICNHSKHVKILY